jgi:tetratricopeptide (TPR) repeat protein/predicted Zn-dependent protease
MSQDSEHIPDDARFAELLRAVDEDVLPPDPAFLEALRQRSLDTFLDTFLADAPAADQPADSEFAPAVVNHPVLPRHSQPLPPASAVRNWRQFMLALAIRSTLAASAAFVMFAAWLVPFPDAKIKAAVPFSDVMKELRDAQSLQLELVKDGHATEVWVRAPGLVRIDDAPQRYRIAAGSRLWRIDETENTVAESDSPWFLSPARQIDLLGLLEVGIADSTAMLKARPVKRTMHEGKACLLYRVNLPGADGPLEVEALADAGTKQFVALLARKADKKGDPANPNPPLAELRLVALNAPVADEKFAVSKSLTEDGRIGTIRDPQGIVVLRPMLAQRWTPLCRETLLKPGDWLRTELRGANAVKVVLSSDTVLTLGPGSQLECLSPTQARLHSGEVQVTLSAKPTPFELLAPLKSPARKFVAEGKTLVRVDRDEHLVDVPQQPKWLAGFEGTSNNESIGSLIVKLPDGRNEPLTVGYHKVSVEIRDQIARTTIEESFVNHTRGRLEGIFHFPLPQDASISGFGMWIGNDLVEADVVEKQRAREIYETILREKRDPGLLEWTGGNIFKARVFPIEPQSEKRVKIVYTQVLPLRANRYRYSYGLRSELLRTNPLRELSLNVTVNSALPLKDISCPTHVVRRQLTAHSGQLEFAAQEYTPTRDFEVVCEVDGQQSDVVVIPHRRGADGYLLVQVTPPTAEGNWSRDVLPDGAPMQLVLLCDTSGSMDSEKRKQQADFVSTVLSSLSANDRFSLVACDVNPVWAAAEPMVATADNIAKAEKFLADRISLGWTDLDRAFSDLLKKAPANAQIVYIGDGIVSAGDSDPAAFINRLGRLVNGTRVAGDAKPAKPDSRLVFHAVTVGNSYESVVLKGIAALGGGSVRSITGEQTPQTVASELLNEIAQPGLRDLKVEFRGLKVAAVYPDRLPNLAAGTQQILVGRYLPEGKDQQGEIVVTGQRGTETVRYAAKVSFKDAEESNSFIPRLWARSHLDHLLQQGSGDVIRDEIIRLSEEFHIITPFTSLLVLETDADRERFGVQRRYEMRDGERFFAEGRSNANFELVQQQMRLAGNWRQGLRRQIVQSWAGLGRHAVIFQRQMQQAERWKSRSELEGFVDIGSQPVGDSAAAQNMTGPVSSTAMWNFDSEAQVMDESRVQLGDSERGGRRAGGIGGGGAFGGRDALESLQGLGYDETAAGSGLGMKRELGESDGSEVFELDKKLSIGLNSDADVDGDLSDDFYASDRKSLLGAEKPAQLPGAAVVMPSFHRPYFGTELAKSKSSLGRSVYLNSAIYDRSPSGRRGHGYAPDYTAWINTIFPTLAAVPRVPVVAGKDPETWTPEALALSRSLLRIESLHTLEGGLELRRIAETFNPNWNRRESQNTDLVLYSPQSWLTRTLNPGTNVIVDYCRGKERGVFSSALLLGRVRPLDPMDLQALPLGLYDSSITALHESMPGYLAHVEPAGENQAKLILKVKESTYELHFTIDTAKHVLVKQQAFDAGLLTSTIVYSDFVQVARTWWAKKSLITDAKGQKIGENTWDVQARTQDQYQQRLDAELTAVPRVQFIHLPFVKLKAARQKVADGSAGFDDRLMLIIHSAGLQLWDDVLTQVTAIEKLQADKPGVRWIRPVIQAVVRRNNEARLWFLDEARRLSANKQPDELYLAEFLLSQAYSITAWSEYLELVQTLKPVYDRQPQELGAVAKWQDRLASCYESLSRPEEALALRKTLAEQTPWNVYAQIEFARRLRTAGQTDASLAWLQQELDRKVERTASEAEALQAAVAEFYRVQARWADLLKLTEQWIERRPENGTGYGEYLSALIYNNQLDVANAKVDAWLREAQIEGKLPAATVARLNVALNYALGQIPHISVQRMQENWIDPLNQAARFFMRHKEHFDVTQRVLGNHYFLQTDASDRLRGEFLEILQTAPETLTTSQLTSLVQWTLSGRIELSQPVNGRKQLDASEIDLEVWKKIAATVQARWGQTQDKLEKNSLSETLVMIYSGRFRDSEYLPFLRERIGSAPEGYKTAYITALFEALLVSNWSDAVEQEAFDRLRQLSDAKEPVERLVHLIPALYRLVDQMVANRTSAASKLLQDKGETQKLTRQELAKKRAEIRTAAQAGVAARLAAEAAKEPLATFAAWMRMEQAWLDVRLNQHLPEMEAECWKILGETPPKGEVPDHDIEDAEALPKHTTAELQQEYIDTLLRQRAFTTILNLASRRSAPPASADRVLKFIDIGIGYGGDRATPWRYAKFQFLVALDRPDELERELREWIRTDVSTAPWRILLGRLLAERGKLDEAVPLFEASEKDKLLSADDYRLLADWYLALNRRESYERARVEAFRQTPENMLNNMMHQIRNRWMQPNIPLPSELDENTLFAWKALFAKTSQPENYLWQLNDLYIASRDFRLLQMLPDAVLGRTPQNAYAFISVIQSQVLHEVRNEATSDEIIARIKKLREGERTPTDLRALDLFEAVVERQSSEVLNQPGPHIDAAVAALQRAFQRKWADGEPVLMSRFLKDLGMLHHPRLVEEQLLELRELQKVATAGSREHLQITADYCHVLFWNYRRQDEALRDMEAVVTAYDQIHKGQWPHQDNELLSGYIRLLEEAKRHAAAETVLQKYLANPEHAEQQRWLRERRLALYNHALQNEGTVSLGTGKDLFQNLVRLALEEIQKAADENVRYTLVVQLVNTFEIGRQKAFESVAPAVRKFAFEQLPVMLKTEQSQYRNMAQAPVRIIHDVLGAHDALRYLVERMEQYPPWMEMEWNNSWNAFAYEFGTRLQECLGEKQGLKDLEPRVLKLTLAELRRELRTGENRNGYVYRMHYGFYWSQKADAFAAAANEVYAERKTSGRRALNVANYLWEGVGLHPRAIEILFLTHQNGLLDVSGQSQLVNWLQVDGRYAEMISLVEPLVRAYPDTMQYRTQLMTAYFRTQRPEQLLEVTGQTDKHFHQGGAWNEGNISMFARACRECGLTDRSVSLFNEAIALHQRSHPGSGLGDQVLSSLYQELALAHSTLGHTKEAVEAASAAIICWNARHEQRKQVLVTLSTVLENAKDLDAFVKHLNEDAAKTGQDSPILRKQIGQIYQKRSQWDLAIAQFQLAVALQPNDKEVHLALIACYDAGDQAKYQGLAIKQLLTLIDLQQHDLTLYTQLAERLKNNEAEAERAATSIIESAPNEAENHTAMAELRQNQARWDEAIPHWEQVAKLRKLEPTGLIKLATAQLHQKQWDAAKKTIGILQRTEWPSRFGDIRGQAQQMLQQAQKM